jgi:membrane protease YdiL (CAAX protease family)
LKGKATDLAWPLLAAFLVIVTALAIGHRRGLATAPMLAAAGGVGMLLVAYFSLGNARNRLALGDWLDGSRGRATLTGLLLLLPYLAYSLSLGTFSLQGSLALLLYLGLPLLLMPRAPRGEFHLLDLALVLLLWLPVELHCLPALWPWPPGQKGHFLDGLLGAVLAVYLFQVVRGLPGIGLTFLPSRRDWLLAGVGLLFFLPIALGIGVASGFLRIAPHRFSAPIAVARMLGIFLVTAVPEELLFRGLLQNFLQQWTRKPLASLALAALLFGAAHLNVGSSPDWRLVLLATLAGVLYGWLYLAAGGIMAPALAHTFVDALWVLLLRK